jgi:hypothetical protein
MADRPDFVEGDTLSKLVIPFLNSKGETIDLTPFTMKLRFWYEGDTTATVRDMVQQDSPNIYKAEYTFQAGELKAGFLYYDAELRDGSNKVVTQLEVVTQLVRPKKPNP